MPPKTELQKVLDKINPTVAEVESALAKVPNINEPYVKGAKTTYLMKAAAFIQDINIIKLLVEKGADITLQDKNGYNALHHATTFNTLEVVTFFVYEKGMNVNTETKNKETPLHLAITNNTDKRIVPYLIERGTSVNAKDMAGVTPLMKALNYFKVDFVKLLLEKGASVERADNAGRSALHYAIETASYNQTNPLGFETVKLLVEKGADVNAKTITGITPLMGAAQLLQLDIAMYLVEKGANINQQETSVGQTPLMIATKFNRVEMVQFLLEKGADKTLRTKSGDTALDFATSDELRNLLKDPEVESKELFKGFTKSDIDLLNRIFEAPSDISICPICLEFAERKDGCMYMTHACRNPHRELFVTYSKGGKVEWCTLCGRVSYLHKHFMYAPPDEKRVAFAPVQPTARGDFRFFDTDCKASGGGGHEEKVRRFNRMLHYACELQSEVGKISEKEGRKKLIEETWKGADIRTQNVPKILEQKKFDFPCEFPADSVPVAEADKVYPDIPKPAGLQPNPIEHNAPDNACLVELGEHDDNRPVFQFIHKQPDGTTWEHKDEYICAEDLESAIRSNPMDGLCRINSEKCKGRIYPEELKGIASPEFYEVYRNNFNKANAVKTGGAVSNMFNHVVNETCAMPPKKTGGKRRTYRKRKNMKKRKTYRRFHK